MTGMTRQDVGLQTGGRPPISLTLPCKAEYMVLCRLVVGALGASEKLDEELIADLKVAVTEACNCFLVDQGPCVSAGGEGAEGELGPALRLDFCLSPEAWDIRVSNPDMRRRILPSSICNPMTGGGLGLTIIQALVDSMERTDDDVEGSVIRLVKRLPAPAV
jgi:serine/threonine-protein kinase RsbW